MKAVGDINGVMTNSSNPHVLCRGKVCAKPEAAQFTFVPMMDPDTYLNKLLANFTIRDSILKSIEKLVKLMRNPACELFSQIKLDLDLIQVLNGKSLKILERKFISTLLQENDFCKTSPRMFTS